MSLTWFENKRCGVHSIRRGAKSVSEMVIDRRTQNTDSTARASTSIIHLSGYIPTGIRLIVDVFTQFTSRACAQRKRKYLRWIHTQNSSRTLTQGWCLAEETYTFQFCMRMNSLFPVRCLLESRTVPHTVFNQYILEVAGLEIQ